MSPSVTRVLLVSCSQPSLTLPAHPRPASRSLYAPPLPHALRRICLTMSPSVTRVLLVSCSQPSLSPPAHPRSASPQPLRPSSPSRAEVLSRYAPKRRLCFAFYLTPPGPLTDWSFSASAWHRSVAQRVPLSVTRTDTTTLDSNSFRILKRKLIIKASRLEIQFPEGI
ncbi:hypothetical protein RRG08_044541 [Elysia crispata]|nr:hypothetical protein RRG08_044541 [Elysia crispata]